MKRSNQTILTAFLVSMVILTCILSTDKSIPQKAEDDFVPACLLTVPEEFQNNDTVSTYLAGAINVITDYELLVEKIMDNEDLLKPQHTISKKKQLDRIVLTGEAVIGSSEILGDWNALENRHNEILYQLDSLDAQAFEAFWHTIEDRIIYLQARYNMAIADSLYSQTLKP